MFPKDNKIRRLREEIGISSRALARMLEVPYRTMEQWESPKEKNYPVSWAEKLILEKMNALRNEGVDHKDITVNGEGNITLAMQDAGLTPERLNESTGIPLQLINDWCNGLKPPAWLENLVVQEIKNIAKQ